MADNRKRFSPQEMGKITKSGALDARYQPGSSVVVAGAVLDDPETDALPTDTDDRRLETP